MAATPNPSQPTGSTSLDKLTLIIFFIFIGLAIFGVVSIFIGFDKGIAIIGLMVALLGALVGYVQVRDSLKEIVKNIQQSVSPVPPQPPAPGPIVSVHQKSQRHRVLQGIIGLFLVVVLGFDSYLVEQQIFPSCPPVVSITFPTQGSMVGSFITVQGTASCIPAGKELWLFVTEESIDGYFPQNMTPITNFFGGWSEDAYIGMMNDPAAIGRTFTLFPALIDQNDSQANNVIQAYFQQGQQTGQYQAISPLPSGIQLLSQVQVVRE